MHARGRPEETINLRTRRDTNKQTPRGVGVATEKNYQKVRDFSTTTKLRSSSSSLRITDN